MLTDKIRADDDSNAMERIEKRIEHIGGALSPITRLVRCSEPEDYIQLFGGFTGQYFAYNPHYVIEESCTSLSEASEALIEKVFLPRYCTPDHCKARYLFLGSAGVNGNYDLQKFNFLMAEVDRRLVNQGLKCHTKSCVKVKVIGGKVDDGGEKALAEPRPEIYFGTRHGRYYIIQEMHQPAGEHGKPLHYCVIESKSIFDEYKTRFEEEWNRGVAPAETVGTNAPALPQSHAL